MSYPLNNKCYHKALPRRKKNRMDGYDYSRTAFYHVIVNTDKKRDWFGIYSHSLVYLNSLGICLMELIENRRKMWEEKFQVRIEIYAIMPDHLHWLLYFNGGEVGISLPEFLKRMKMDMSYCINQKIRAGDSPEGSSFSWQVNCYERYMRNEDEFWNCFRYIKRNPYQLFYKRLEEGIYEQLEKVPDPAEEIWEKETVGMKTIYHRLGFSE